MRATKNFVGTFLLAFAFTFTGTVLSLIFVLDIARNIDANGGGGGGVEDASDLMTVPGSENGHVEEAAEYRFFLYRHWSLYDAMYHSPYVAAKLSVWSQQGKARLDELLARMGVPLQQCKQAYQYMAPALRGHFTVQMGDESILNTYNLTNPGVTFKVTLLVAIESYHVVFLSNVIVFVCYGSSSSLPRGSFFTVHMHCTQSFYRYNSFKNPVAASDIVHAATALTEMYGVSAFSSGSGSNSNGATTGAAGGSAEDADGGDANATTIITSSSSAVAAGRRPVSSDEAFYEAYSCLGMRTTEVLDKGVQAALDLQRVSQ